jgi:UDP-glucose 4-epimerase
MQILITGGAGFIGSHLVDALVERGDRVTVLDDFSTGSHHNLAACPSPERLKVVTGSVTDARLVEELMDEAEFAYHLASVVGVQLVLERPIETVLTCTVGAVAVMEAASRYDVPCVVVSTSEVYGKGGESKKTLSESDDLVLGAPGRARWSYGAAKANVEHLAAAYHQQSGLRVLVVRPFNVVGPRQSGCYGMVIPRFVEWALHGQPLKVYGDGSQTRCFTFVADAVRLLIALAAGIDDEFRIVNIGSTERISILELANLVLELTGSTSSLQFVPHSDVGVGFEDMHDRAPDLSLLQHIVGDLPRTDLRTSIRAVINDLEKGPVRAGPPLRSVAAT